MFQDSARFALISDAYFHLKWSCISCDTKYYQHGIHEEN